MKELTVRQKQILAEFLSQLAVAVITVGGITVLFDQSLLIVQKLNQFTISVIVGILLLIISLFIIKK